MVLVRALGLVLVVVLVRELARWLVLRGPFRIRAMFDHVTPGSLGRRFATIAAGLVAMYLAIVGLGLGYAATYGVTTSHGYYSVAEVLEDGASVGKLRAGDRIEAIDGEPIEVGTGRSLVERINDKGGAPVDVHIRRDREAHVIRIEPRQGSVRDGSPKWLIGIRPRFEAERTTAGALGFAFA
jgi:C-terminal processing protease CtpA/Prc